MVPNHEATVRKFFSQPSRYLHRRFGIRIRKDIIEGLTAAVDRRHVIDLGCGDGSLSLRLLPVQCSLCGRDIFYATLSQTVQDLGVAELQRRLRELGQ